jgi:hypothetical protein
MGFSPCGSAYGKGGRDGLKPILRGSNPMRPPAPAFRSFALWVWDVFRISPLEFAYSTIPLSAQTARAAAQPWTSEPRVWSL